MLLARPLRSRIIASASSLDIVGLSAGSREDETAGVEDGRSISVESESDGSARGTLVVVEIVWKIGSECSSWMWVGGVGAGLDDSTAGFMELLRCEGNFLLEAARSVDFCLLCENFGLAACDGSRDSFLP